MKLIRQLAPTIKCHYSLSGHYSRCSLIVCFKRHEDADRLSPLSLSITSLARNEDREIAATFVGIAFQNGDSGQLPDDRALCPSPSHPAYPPPDRRRWRQCSHRSGAPVIFAGARFRRRRRKLYCGDGDDGGVYWHSLHPPRSFTPTR